MPVRFIAGLHIVIALVMGYWGLQMMFTPSSGGRFFWWPLIMFGAPILLLVGGILTLFPQVKKRWFVALTGTILFVIWIVFMRDFSWTYCIFATVVMLSTWGTLAFASAVKRGGVVAFIASLALAASWLPGSVTAFRAYLFPNPPATNPPVLLALLVLWALIIASIVTGVMLSKSPGPRGLGQSAARPTTTTR